MLKKFLFISLIMLGLVAAPVLADDTAFSQMYDKSPDCFMTFDFCSGKRVVSAPDNEAWIESVYYGVGQELALPFNPPTGCPPAWICPEVIVVEVEAKTFIVFFDFDKSNIRGDQVVVLEEAMAYAKSIESPSVELSSFCDFRGSNEYNLGLGQNRAESVKAWLVANGLDVSFNITNNGKMLSLVKALTSAGFCKECQVDRRVEITVE